jgi:hypothetical protein
VWSWFGFPDPVPLIYNELLRCRVLELLAWLLGDAWGGWRAVHSECCEDDVDDGDVWRWVDQSDRSGR